MIFLYPEMEKVKVEKKKHCRALPFWKKTNEFHGDGSPVDEKLISLKWSEKMPHVIFGRATVGFWKEAKNEIRGEFAGISQINEKLILKSKAENTRGVRELMNFFFFEVKRKMPDEIFSGVTGLFQSEAKDEICGSRSCRSMKN